MAHLEPGPLISSDAVIFLRRISRSFWIPWHSAMSADGLGCLLSGCWGKPQPRVRIPLSPPVQISHSGDLRHPLAVWQPVRPGSVLDSGCEPLYREEVPEHLRPHGNEPGREQRQDRAWRKSAAATRQVMGPARSSARPAGISVSSTTPWVTTARMPWAGARPLPGTAAWGSGPCSSTPAETSRRPIPPPQDPK